MAGIIIRRRAVAAVAIALATLALAACGSKSDQGGNVPGDAQIGGVPSDSAGPTDNPSGGPAPTGGGGNTAPIYPRDAKSYAQELLKAWGNKDYSRLGQLAIQSAVQQIRDSVNSGGVPNSQWTNIKCAAAQTNGFTDCLFRNAHGDETTIKLRDTQLGFPTAVTEAPLYRTAYPSDPGSYVGQFLQAWHDGNQQRMARLSSDAIKNSFLGKPQISGYTTLTTMMDGTYSKVTISGLGVDLGKSFGFKVLTASGGKANAIKNACMTSGCNP